MRGGERMEMGREERLSLRFLPFLFRLPCRIGKSHPSYIMYNSVSTPNSMALVV